jgi:hypothetical protein
VQADGVLEELAHRCGRGALFLERLGRAAQRAQILEHSLGVAPRSR